MDDDDINLSIPVKPIWEEFTCPICYEMVRECYMTNCSHNFCKDCITEWLDRKKQCPCCNTATTKQQISPNKQFDRILVIIQDEKDKASKNYFDKLIGGSSSNSGGQIIINSQPLSPIEELFHTHVKRSLANYEEYYKKLKSKHDARIEKLRRSYTDKMTQYASKGKKSIHLSQDPQISSWKIECEEKVTELNESFQKSVEMLLRSYDDYMKSFAPAPQFLPVTLNIVVPSKGVKILNLVISPTETIADIKLKLRERMEKQGDPIVNFEKSNIFVLMNSPELGNSDKRPIIDEDVPIVQYQPEPGATLELQGNLKCKSDAPKQCFKSTYDKDSNVTMDYYTCKDCKINWICKSCAESCHKGHTVVDYILNHKPSWACCYCPKNPIRCKLFKKD